MSYFNNKRNFWIILFLVLLNLVTIGFMWINRPKPLGHPVGPPPPAGFLIKELEFDKEQADAVKVQMDGYFSNLDSIRKQLRQNRQLLLTVISRENVDSSEVERLLTVNESLHTRENRLFIDHYRAMSAICREDQQQRLNRVFSKAMAPPPRAIPGKRRPPGRE